MSVIILKVQVTINVLLEDKINPKSQISIINSGMVADGWDQVYKSLLTISVDWDSWNFLHLWWLSLLSFLHNNYEIKSKFDLGDVSEIKRKFLWYDLNYEVGGGLKRG